MFNLIEPLWSVNISRSLFAWMQASTFLSHWMPILADVFVLTYPVFLVILYVYGMITKKLQYKISAVFIFFGTLLSAIVNLLIQYFIIEARPNVVLGLPDLKHETIFHKFLPSSSFPSDHAAVSMGIAFSSIVWGVKNKDKKYIRFGIILILFSLITSFSRLTTGVHWITDVIGGSIVGIIVPWILMNKKIYRLIDSFGRWIGRYI
ncbi:MAG: phosphatase PAP2 family protein [candidate division SR1 bacterium]|nr:phosphatase PAP2 family protein [candidate division SR1 bacterium]